MRQEILFIADDFGLSDEVNRAIVHAHLHGVLDGTGLMMGQPGTEDAIRLAREHPSLQIGWHLHLNDSRPCTRDAWPWGASPAKAGFAIGLLPQMRRLMRREIEHQWRAFEETGLPCRFVNTHHHLHLHPLVRRTLLSILPDGFSGWVRWGQPKFFEPGLQSRLYAVLDAWVQAGPRRRFPHPMSTTLWGIDRTFTMDADEVAMVIPNLSEGLHEFMFHPRRLDGDPDTRCLLELKDRLNLGSKAHQ